MNADNIDKDQMPMKRRLQAEFAKAAADIAIEEAPARIKQQIAEMELYKKNKGKPPPEKKPEEITPPPTREGPAKTVSKESGGSALEKAHER